MQKINNVNIENLTLLPAPAQVRSELPVGVREVASIASARQTVREILDGRDKRLMVIVGPCSIHDPSAALEYAAKLKKLSD